VGKGTIVRIENGESATPRTAKKIADTLNISVADLLESPPVPLGQAPTTSYKPPEEAEKSNERREELLVEESIEAAVEDISRLVSNLVEDVSRSVSNLVDAFDKAVLEVARKGEYRDLLVLAERLDKAAQTIRGVVDVLLKDGQLTGAKSHIVVSRLDDLDSLVADSYTQAIRSIEKREVEVVELPLDLDECRRRRDAAERRVASSA